MPVTIKNVELYKDEWWQGKLKRNLDIIGLGVEKVNISLEVEGGDFPPEIEVEIRTREPGIKLSKKGTVQPPIRKKIARFGTSPFYMKKVPLSEVGTFWQAEMGALEYTTLVRAQGTSDAHFRGPLATNGWFQRGIGHQPSSPGGDTGNDLLEQPDAKKLLFAGVEVLEVAVVKQPGWKVKQEKDWAYVRSPADVFYYSGHGAIWNGQLILHHDYDDWVGPEELLSYWKMSQPTPPADLDVLIINGCSLLNWEEKTGHDPMKESPSKDSKNIGLRWGKLMCTTKNGGGPLRVMLGFYDSAPIDDVPNPRALTGNKIAENFAARMAKLGSNYDAYAQAWLDVNKSTRAAAAIDMQGYWFTNKSGNVEGPFKLPG